MVSISVNQCGTRATRTLRALVEKSDSAIELEPGHKVPMRNVCVESRSRSALEPILSSGNYKMRPKSPGARVSFVHLRNLPVVHRLCQAALRWARSAHRLQVPIIIGSRLPICESSLDVNLIAPSSCTRNVRYL